MQRYFRQKCVSNFVAARSIKKLFSSSVWKSLTGLHLTFTPSNTFGINWNTRPKHPTSVLDLTDVFVSEWEQLNTAGYQHVVECLKSGGCYSARLMPMVLEGYVQQSHIAGMFRCPHTLFRCPHTLSHIVYFSVEHALTNCKTDKNDAHIKGESQNDWDRMTENNKTDNRKSTFHSGNIYELNYFSPQVKYLKIMISHLP